ncbi:MAG: hypothetical protein WAV40_02755 [Microgenomates group bacterium]
MSFILEIKKDSKPEIFTLGGTVLPRFNDDERPATIRVSAENLESDVQASLDEPLPSLQFDLPIEWGSEGYSVPVTQFVSIILRCMRQDKEFMKSFRDGAVELANRSSGKGVFADSNGLKAGRTMRLPGLGLLTAT